MKIRKSQLRKIIYENRDLVSSILKENEQKDYDFLQSYQKKGIKDIDIEGDGTVVIEMGDGKCAKVEIKYFGALMR